MHKCHASRCVETIEPDRLFCPHHWRMLSNGEQHGLLHHYMLGQAADPSKATPAWYAALEGAIRTVARIEGVVEELVGSLPGQDPVQEVGP